MARAQDIQTPECRLSFTGGLFKLQTSDDSDKKNWGCVLLFPKSINIDKLKENALEAATLEWGDKAVQWLKDGVISNPFLDGDGKEGVNKKSGERNVGFAGQTFIRVVSGEAHRPKVVDRNVVPVLDVSGCPSGYYGQAVINAFTWDNPKKGKGISFGISAVQVQREGERLGGGDVDVNKFFEKISDEKPPESTSTGKGAGGLFG